MKGIILAGGSGSRLFPLTEYQSKHLLPVFDKPLIYYPLSALMLAGIKDYLIICRQCDIESYSFLLRKLEYLGLRFSFEVQDNPNGIAESLILSEKFLQGSDCVLILGDNIFFGNNLSSILKNAIKENFGCTIFSYEVSDPNRFGVLELKDDKVINIIEKPIKPPSNQAVTGIYVYKNIAVEYAKTLTPSKRGELEITDLNKMFLNKDNLSYKLLGRGISWLDAGTPDSLLEASNLIRIIQKYQTNLICSPEEIALRNEWVSRDKLLEQVINKSSTYYQRLLKICK